MRIFVLRLEFYSLSLWVQFTINQHWFRDVGSELYRWRAIIWTNDGLIYRCISQPQWVNTLRPKQNGRQFADDTFKRISLNENVRISIKISLNFVPYGPINNILALVQIMAWRWSGDKPLFEPMLVSLPTHICVTWPQWVKSCDLVIPWAGAHFTNENFYCDLNSMGLSLC